MRTVSSYKNARVIIMQSSTISFAELGLFFKNLTRLKKQRITRLGILVRSVHVTECIHIAYLRDTIEMFLNLKSCR